MRSSLVEKVLALLDGLNNVLLVGFVEITEVVAQIVLVLVLRGVQNAQFAGLAEDHLKLDI